MFEIIVAKNEFLHYAEPPSAGAGAAAGASANSSYIYDQNNVKTRAFNLDQMIQSLIRDHLQRVVEPQLLSIFQSP